MALQTCGLNMNNTKKELQIHGTAAFPCAGYVSGHSESLEDLIPWHWHEEMEAILITKGVMSLSVLSEKILIHEGELALINADALHMATGAPYCELESMVFSPRLVTGTDDSAMAVKYITPLVTYRGFTVLLYHHMENAREIDLFSEAFEALRTDAYGYEFQAREALTQLLLTAHRQLEANLSRDNEPKNTDALRLAGMLEYIHQNYAGNLSLADIAGEAGISEREALRCFKRTIGESPVQYLVKYRLMQSANLLISNPAESIVNIAEQCGFDSPAYYTKKFRELYKVTPKEYRKGISGKGEES